MILRLPCAVANPTSIASTTNAAPPTVLFAPHHCRKTAALKANKIRNLFYFTEFLFFVAAYCYAIRRRLRLLPDGQYGYAIGAYCSAIRRSGYAYCPAGQYGYAIGAYCYAIRRSGYAYCPMGNTATQLAPIAAQYGARIAIAMYKRHECKYINRRFHSLSSRKPLMGFIWNRASFTPGVAGGYSP